MNKAVTDNPNMCSDCERLVFDDSPTLAATGAQETLAGEDLCVSQQNMASAEAHLV